MRIILFGATGMVGQGVLRECLTYPSVEAVLVIGRSTCGTTHPRLTEIIHRDLFDFAALEAQLSGYDACFFCLGVSSGGMGEAEYSKVTYDLTLAAATTLAKVNPAMTFIYVSGAGTDSSEKGRSMWARVKGRTENALAALPFKAVYLFRPGLIQPLHGITSKTPAYRWLYSLVGPLLPALKAVAPGLVTTTANVGLAMIRVASKGHAGSPILENRDINLIATGRSA